MVSICPAWQALCAFIHRLISNFTKHELPFTHLVMDFGWHQQQHGSAWASYTWSKEFGETPADVQDFVQSLHSTDTASPMQRPLALSLNLHAVGVEPEELRYREFMQQVTCTTNTFYRALLPFDLPALVWPAGAVMVNGQSPTPCRSPLCNSCPHNLTNNKPGRGRPVDERDAALRARE